MLRKTLDLITQRCISRT